MGSNFADFLCNAYKKEMAPYLDGRPEYLDYVGKEDYYLKLKEMEYAIANVIVLDLDWNPYVHGRHHAHVRSALRKMGWKKIFEIYEHFGKTSDAKIIYREASKFSQILSNYDFWKHIDDPKIPFKEKFKKQCEPRFAEVGKAVRKLSWKDYANYISAFSDVYDRFPSQSKSYYLIGLSIVDPKLLIRLNRQYGSETVADSIIDLGKQQQNKAQEKQEIRGLLYSMLNSCMMASGSILGTRAGASPYITACMGGIAGLMAFHALVKYHKGQKQISERREEQKFFTESPEIINIQAKMRKSFQPGY